MGKGRVFLAAVAMAAASACGSDSTGPGGGGGAPPVASNQVSIGNDFFNAPNIVVPAGTTVTWTWNSGTEDAQRHVFGRVVGRQERRRDVQPPVHDPGNIQLSLHVTRRDDRLGARAVAAPAS